MRHVAKSIVLACAAVLVAAAPPPQSSKQIVDAAPAAAWRTIAPDDLLVMQLAGGQRVVIQLAPTFAPIHVANVRRLAHAGYWHQASIVRVQDNYVVQWAATDPPKTLPPGVVALPPPEYERPATETTIRPLPYRDAYAPTVGYADGWPVASDGTKVWLTHCYGMVGVGRDLPPDTGTGAELYAVIGQPLRHLDRNIPVIGRVLEGMPALSSLPRGAAELGFYASPAQRIPISLITLAADLPPQTRPRYEIMRTDSPAFAAYLDARANRRDAFFVRPAGAVDLCNAPVPVRAIAGPH
jgi:peptidylprolyl isomerase